MMLNCRVRGCLAMLVIKKLQELKSNLLLGLIDLKRYNKELDEILEKVDNEFDRQVVNSYKDVDI